MKEAKGHRSVYDIPRTSAWSGPHKRPTNKLASVLLAIAIGLLLAIAVMAWATECTTDSECQCTDDCLAPAK